MYTKKIFGLPKTLIETVSNVLNKNNDESFMNENIIGNIKGVIGLGWKNIGDVAKGSVVLDYVFNNNYYTSESKEKKIISNKFKLIEIDLKTARKYRDYTDNISMSGSVIDPDKEKKVKKYKLTYDSMLRRPPVIMKDGHILDGNHRLELAIEMGISKIPVLMQV